ncbi:hypothetical protein ACSQ67_015483 [Phaseolus vulgaris]
MHHPMKQSHSIPAVVETCLTITSRQPAPHLRFSGFDFKHFVELYILDRLFCEYCFETLQAPFLRWKQYPVVSALFTFATWAIIFPITNFLHIQSVGSFALASILWYQTKYVDVTNPASTRSFYSFNWKVILLFTILYFNICNGTF